MLANNLPIGGCHPLALDPALPWALIGLTASNATTPFATRQLVVAWTDSATQQLSLTLHRGMILPDMPYTTIPERASCYSSSAAATGSLVKTNFGNLFIRYQRWAVACRP